MNFGCFWRLVYCALAMIPIFCMANDGVFSISCDDPDSRYECGEKVVFNVRSSLTNGIAHVRLDNFGSRVLREFDVDLSKTRDFTVEGGREAGWPRLIESQTPENQAAAIKNAPYFDGVNFASMITCPAVFSVGYTDVVSPPHAGYAAFNACPAKEKAMIGSVGFGHRISPDDSARMRTWFENSGRGLKKPCD